MLWICKLIKTVWFFLKKPFPSRSRNNQTIKNSPNSTQFVHDESKRDSQFKFSLFNFKINHYSSNDVIDKITENFQKRCQLWDDESEKMKVRISSLEEAILFNSAKTAYLKIGGEDNLKRLISLFKAYAHSDNKSLQESVIPQAIELIPYINVDILAILQIIYYMSEIRLNIVFDLKTLLVSFNKYLIPLFEKSPFHISHEYCLNSLGLAVRNSQVTNVSFGQTIFTHYQLNKDPAPETIEGFLKENSEFMAKFIDRWNNPKSHIATYRLTPLGMLIANINSSIINPDLQPLPNLEESLNYS